MAPSIETIDNLPKTQPRDRVSEIDRSKEEQDQEAFKKALKRKLLQQGKDGEETEDEALIVEIDLAKKNDEDPDESAAAPEGTDHATEPEPDEESGDTEESPAPPDHIDLKA